MTQIDAGHGATQAEPKRHVHLQQVRYADLDPQHHVNNVRMLTYLEDARISFLHPGAPTDREQDFGALVVARQEADYIAPLLPRSEPVRVELWVTEIRNTGFSLAYEILDDTTVYLRARTVMVGFDVATQRPRRLSAAEHKFLAAHS